MTEQIKLQDAFNVACTIIGQNVVFEELRARQAQGVSTHETDDIVDMSPQDINEQAE